MNLYRSRSRKGAWIEIALLRHPSRRIRCRSRKGAWIEISSTSFHSPVTTVAPVRERGLKSSPSSPFTVTGACRSRKGAWIEIIALFQSWLSVRVAPVRERGLKLWLRVLHAEPQGRSRKGAWIEISTNLLISLLTSCRSRKGAWIEIKLSLSQLSAHCVAPVRERGLK